MIKQLYTNITSKKLYIGLAIKKLFVLIPTLNLYTGSGDDEEFDGFDYTFDFTIN